MQWPYVSCGAVWMSREVWCELGNVLMRNENITICRDLTKLMAQNFGKARWRLTVSRSQAGAQWSVLLTSRAIQSPKSCTPKRPLSCTVSSKHDDNALLCFVCASCHFSYINVNYKTELFVSIFIIFQQYLRPQKRKPCPTQNQSISAALTPVPIIQTPCSGK